MNKSIKKEQFKDVLTAYRALVAKKTITHDPAQDEVAVMLDALAGQLLVVERNKGLFGRLWASRPSEIEGLYIWGDVGRGKSMMMDLFYDLVPVTAKRRVHFHAFMLEVHGLIHRYRQKYQDGDPIPAVAKKLADKAWLLCFDEMQVSDIADAMILGRLFEALFERGVVVVATSNRPPDDLYKDGLQRQRFEPFIDLFKEKLEVVELVGKLDYRLQHLKSLSTVYFTPLGKKAKRFMATTFKELTAGSAPESCVLSVQGRKLKVRRMHGNVAWMTFAELCETALGAADYQTIAQEFSTVLVEGIPKMTREYRNEAKRFMTLIDELYEHKVKLVCTADALPKELYGEGDGVFEFARTISRLIEMQSEKYLKSGHVC